MENDLQKISKLRELLFWFNEEILEESGYNIAPEIEAVYSLIDEFFPQHDDDTEATE